MAGVKRLRRKGDTAFIGNENNEVKLGGRTTVRVTINGTDVVWERPSPNHKWAFEEASGDFVDSENGKVIQDTNMVQRVPSMHPELGQAIELDAGFEVLTSKPYPIYSYDGFEATSLSVNDFYILGAYTESYEVSNISVGNFSLKIVLKTYDSGDAEAFEPVGVSVGDFSLVASLVTYSDGAPEGFEATTAVIGDFALKDVLLTYSDGAPEGFEATTISIGNFSFVNTYDPATLFTGTENGAWYDPSDLSTLYQDSAGTTPVTADGDPVGRIEDKSGNGNHLTQDTASAKPIYKTDGTLHWLLFDGVDDALQGSGLVCSGTDSFTAIIGVLNLSDNPDGDRAVRFGDNTNAGGRAVGLGIDDDGASYRHNDGAKIHSVTWTTPTVPYVLTFGRDSGLNYAGADDIRKNGSALTETAVNNGTNTTASMVGEEIILGAGRGGVDSFGANANFKMYGTFLIAPKIADTDRDKIEIWMAGKSGITL